MPPANYDRFFIHTSLSSNVIDQTGKKSDLLAIVTADPNNRSDEYVCQAAIGRDYICRDNISALKNFYVEVRDQLGNPIDFSDVGGCEIEIIIWIQPRDPALYAY